MRSLFCAFWLRCVCVWWQRECHFTRDRLELFSFSWDAVGQGLNPVETHGRWCGGKNSGLRNCCAGSACAACTAAADQWQYPDNACTAACPPVDAVDTLCMNHDFCISAQQYRTGSITTCKYSPPGFLSYFISPITANYCPCDKAVYDGVVALGGSDGFKGNLKTMF